MSQPLDDINRSLLRLLLTDGRETVRALARAVGLSEPAVRDRIAAMERRGVIRGYRVDIDPDAVMAGTAAFVSVRFVGGAQAKAKLTAALSREPEILEVHEVAGDECLLLKVRVPSTVSLADTLDQIRAMPHISSTSSTIVLRTIFERSAHVPVQGLPS